MQKQAPSLGRILTMVLFALSCFGLLLFLWLSFGGPIPLKPKGYRVKVSFPEATQLSLAAGFHGRGQDISDAFGNLPTFATDATVLVQILDQEAAPLQRLIRDTGGVFEALTQDEGALHNLIVNSASVFSATASQNE